MNYKLALLFGVLVWMGILPLYAVDTPPVMNGNDTSPKYYKETNTPVALFPDFTITDAENDDIKGLVIAFTSGNHTDQDILSFSAQNGITGSFDKTKGTLVLSGAASPADYQTAVRSITYSNDAAPGAVSYDQRELTISFANSDYLASTGHFYEFINSALYWDAAKTAASAKTYYGLQGYLATVTSAEENSFVKSKISSYNTWLGGSDAATEGSWLWATGPEKDTQFSTGATAYNSSYVNWKSGEPNNTNGIEDCLLMNYSDGSWNDGGNNTNIRYTVEYGGMTGDPTINMTTTTTLNVVAPQPPVMDGHDTSPTYFANGTATPLTLFPDFTISGAEIRGLVIAFTSGNHTDQDILSFTDQNGITGTFDKTKGALILSGLASPEDYQAAVRSITYSNDAATGSVSEDQRELTIALANSDYLKSTGHFYEYVNAAVTWSEAAAAASAKTYYGLQGYLATVTSAEENSFILNKISDMIWLGGSDRETEGTWKWVTGPESGNQFSTGANAYNGSYVNWNSGEPNSSTTAEDYLMMYASTNPGEWNDINLERTYGYVVEYGGMTGDPSLNMTTTTTLNVLLPPKNLSYADAPVSGVYGTAITAISPTVTGTVDSYSVSPSLPAGLILDKTTGKISGTPTEVSAQTDYTVTATNDAGSTTTTIQITVDKRTLTVTATAENKIYDGTTTATVTFSDDRVSGDVLTVANTSAVFDDKNVGSGKTVTVSGISISGTAAGNYTLTSATAGTTADITAKTLTVSAAADNKEYDGTTTATVTLSDDRVSGDVLTVANTSAVFDDKNVGSGKTVTVSGISISGTDAGNYALTSTTAIATADITKAALNVTANDQSKTYGEANPTLTISYSGFVGSDSESDLTTAPTATTTATTTSGAGTYTITVSGGADNNYTFSYTDGTLTVGKAALSVTADNQNKTYGEANPTLTVSYSGFIGSDSESDLTTAPTATTTATTTSGAGTYTITPAGGVSGNYTFSYTDGTMTVNKAALSVTADDQSKTYGEVNPTLTVSYSGFVGSDGASDLTTAPTATTTATTTSGAGTYTITPAGGVSDNYTFSYTDGTLTVDKAALSVTADDQSKTYGEANPTLTISYSGFVGSDSESDLTTAPTATTTATTASGAGTYTITPAGGVSDNYTFSYTDGTLTVNKAALSVTANDQSKTYGEANPTLTVSYSGFVGSDSESDLTTAPTATTTATTTSGAGTYTITPAGGVSDNYTFSYTGGTLTVDKATLSVTADDQSKTYGEANPTLTVSYSGFVGSDGASALTTAPTATTTATMTSGAGTYAITASGGVSDNYTFSYTDGTLTVNKAALSVTADDQSKTYGEANPTLTVSYSGFVGSDGASDLTTAPTAATTATIISGAGTYPITVSGGADNNYTFSHTDGTLTVNKAALSVTADDQSKTYGDANPTLTVSYSGFVGSDSESDLATAPTVSTTSTTTSGAGTYPITVSGGADNNYMFSYTNGTLTVGKATLNVTADDQSKIYGEANPTLTLSYSGFVGSDSESDLTTAPTASTTATTTSGAGTYAITASGGVSDNYRFSYTDGTLTVDKAALSVTADDQSKTYGEANPTLTVSYSGFVGSDGASDLTTAPTATTTATTTSGAGTYAITASGGVSDNYTFSYTDGTLTVDKAALSVTADDQSKTYGEANPTLTVSYSGFVGSDSESDLTTAPTATTTATTTSGAGTYTITPAGGVSDNYTFSYTDGTLTVNKALLSVTADDQSKTYGEANPTLTVSYSGFVGSDGASDLTTAPTATTTATTTSGAGTYTITPAGGVSDNYTFSYTDGTLTVDKAALSVTADDQSKTYGEANPALTVSYSGFVGSDGASDLTTAPTATTTATTASGAGTYTIIPAGGVSDNYTFSYTDGTLTVGKSDQTITFGALAGKTYGDATFDLTATSSSGLAVTYSSSNTGVATVSGSTVTIIGAGTATIAASQAGDDTYNAAPDVQQTLTVGKASLSVTADDQSKIYGEANPTLTVSYSGFVGSDGASDLTTAPTASTTATTTSGAGTYTIIPAGGVSDNYTFSYTDGTLTVGKAALSVTADDQNKTYGEANPTLTVSYSGFVGSDGASALTTAPTATTTATTTSEAGTYAITASGGVSDNYTFSYTDGTLTVGKVALSVTADDQSKTYGEPNPALTITYSGFVGSDSESDLDTAPVATTTATISSANGDYPITVSGGADNNYTFSYTDGTLIVGMSTQTITFGALSGKTYGDAAFDLTATSSSGLAVTYSSSDESVATVSGSTVTIVGAGTATITASQPGNSNYSAAADVRQTLTVDKAPLTVKADDQGKIYGDVNPELTISYNGFVGSEDKSVLTSAPTATTMATTTSGAGTYPITVSGGVSNNYTFTYTNGTLTVNKATLTVTADDKSKAYGEANPALTVTYSGFVGSDSESDLDTAPVATTTATISSANGDYPITVSGGADNNYTFSYVDGTLTVGKKTQSITFNSLENRTSKDAGFELNATSSSGLPVVFTSSDKSVAICTGTNGSTVEIVGVGSCIIYADQPGNLNYDAAPQVEQPLTVVSYIAGDTNHDGIIDNGEIAGDTNGDGQITSPEVAGDTNGDGTIDNGEVAGDTNGDGQITSPEVAGDTNGDGTIDNGEIAGDTNGDGQITSPEVAGDTNGDGTIDNGEIAGDTNGDGQVTPPEVAGDTNGDGTIDKGEIAGDTNGDGQVNPPEIAGDTNGDGTIDNGEIAGDTNGDGQVTSPEIIGDTNGDGTIDNGEVAGDTNGDGIIDNGETKVINPKTDHANIKYLFSPNGDGINDYWKIPNILDLGRVHVKIYDRWGNLMFESTDYQNNWDGTYKGKPVPEGAYIYFIITQKNGTQSGVVNLVR